MNLQTELTQHPDYWAKILSPDVCANIPPEEQYPPLSAAYQKEYEAIRQIFIQTLQALGQGEIELYVDTLPFAPFYEIFGRAAVTYAAKKHLPLLQNREEAILTNLYTRIAPISMRVLIRDIHRCKDEGLLKGEDTKEEYEDYCVRFLGNRAHVKRLCDTYPEMQKLLLMQSLNLVLFLEEITTAVERDKEQLERVFFPGGSFCCVESIACGQSDAHRQGRTVARVHLDKGRILIYKPRSVGKETRFEELYGEFCQRGGMDYALVHALDCGSYGWQAFVKREKCADQEAVKRYFERMGILLFLCYSMSAGDIHGENILAAGEYPVLIDLEAFPGIWKREQPGNAEDLVREELKASVLATGILPVTMWQHEGHGVILNAIHGRKTELTPFQIPVLQDAGTSDIHIGYRRGEIHLEDSLPICDGIHINPADYTEVICRGFRSAYECFLQNREEMEARFEAFFMLESRHLLRHTQQYSMVLNTSYYPDFLESEEKRRLFFHTLDKRAMIEAKKELFLPYERNALYQMDIPIYFMKGRERALWDGAGRKYPDVLKASAWDLWTIKRARLGEKDLKKQLRYMELSLALLKEYRPERPKASCSSNQESFEALEGRRMAHVKAIADQICDLAVVYDGQDISFSGLHFQDEKNWSIAPTGIYLYDGMSGVAVFLVATWKTCPNSRYEKIWKLLVQKMFCYTEQIEKGGRPESLHTGAYVGEGSLVYAYLLLYEITGEASFLEYAKRHSKIVMLMAKHEESMDLLSGLAGAVVVLLKLYQYEREESCLAVAKQMEEEIWKQRKQMESVVGWCMKGIEQPLAGMAHGNSGMLLAYVALYQVAPSATYLERIREILCYEDSLFDQELENWLDLRHENGVRTSSNAWCHGASGILLSRLKLREIDNLPEDIKAQVELDIERSLCVFRKGRDTQEVCLCHGHAGDYVVLHRYASATRDQELLAQSQEQLVQLLEKLEVPQEIRVQERENISLMTGMAGVGMALLEF